MKRKTSRRRLKFNFTDLHEDSSFVKHVVQRVSEIVLRPEKNNSSRKITSKTWNQVFPYRASFWRKSSLNICGIRAHSTSRNLFGFSSLVSHRYFHLRLRTTTKLQKSQASDAKNSNRQRLRKKKHAIKISFAASKKETEKKDKKETKEKENRKKMTSRRVSRIRYPVVGSSLLFATFQEAREVGARGN